MTPETPSAEILSEAAAWSERLHQPVVSEETQSAFATWLADAEAHGAAYEAVERTWVQVQGAAIHPQILALRHETALRLTRRGSTSVRFSRWAAAATALIIVSGSAALLGGWLHSDRVLQSAGRESPPEPTMAHYATEVGEQLTATLTDGSQVTLDTQSALDVAFTPSERAVRLARGQIYLKVAKNHQRPFVVEAANRRIVAVGTAFDVRVEGTQVRVAMVEGTVRVEPRQGPGAATNAPHLAPIPAVTLTAGQQLLVDAGAVDRVTASEPNRATNWLRGQIVFDNARLTDAVAEVNRYSKTKVELADPAIGQLRLSGAFATGTPALFIEAVTSYFPVQVRRADDQRIILSAKQ
jgi:transmembrane sensor